MGDPSSQRMLAKGVGGEPHSSPSASWFDRLCRRLAKRPWLALACYGIGLLVLFGFVTGYRIAFSNYPHLSLASNASTVVKNNRKVSIVHVSPTDEQTIRIRYAIERIVIPPPEQCGLIRHPTILVNYFDEKKNHIAQFHKGVEFDSFFLMYWTHLQQGVTEVPGLDNACYISFRYIDTETKLVRLAK